MEGNQRVLMKYRDIIVGFLLCSFSVFMFFQTYSIQVLNAAKGSLGPAMTPRVIFISIFVLGIIIIIGGIVQLKQNSELPPAEERKRPLIVLLSMVAFAGFLNILGFVIITPLYIFSQTFLLMPKDKWNVKVFLIISIIATGFIYFIFRFLLKVNIPMGILG